jgi:BT1 family
MLKIKSLWILNLILGIQVTIYHYTFRKDLLQYGFPMTTINLIRLLAHLPWNLKPLPALFCVDGIGCKGYHRKPHIMIGSAVACVCISILSSPDVASSLYISMITLFNVFLVLADVAIDGYMIDSVRIDSNAIVNADVFRTIGYIIGDTSAALLWEHVHSNGVYGIVAGVTGLMTITAVFMKDTTRLTSTVNTVNGTHNIPDYSSDVVGVVIIDDKGESVRPLRIHNHFFVQCKLIWSTLTNKAIFALLIVSFLANIIPSSSLPMFYYLTEELKFSSYTMSILGFVSSVVRVVTLVMYRGFTVCGCTVKGLRTLSIRTIFVGVTLTRILVNIMPAILSYQVEVQVNNNGTITTEKQSLVVDIGLNPIVFSIGDTVFEEILDTLQALPLKQIIGHICENGVEAGVFATAMSTLNIGNAIQGLIDTGIMQALGIDHGNYDGLFFSIMISQVCTLVVSIVACFSLPDITDEDISQQRNNEKASEFLSSDFTTEIPQQTI